MKAVFFDLDGTLIDSLEDLGQAVNRTLADLGLPGHPVKRSLVPQQAKQAPSTTHWPSLTRHDVAS
jgi:phosphoglycolate phosphatase-like HAD superfamily hydrolase